MAWKQTPENQNNNTGNEKLSEIDAEIAKAKADLERFWESPSEEVRENVKKVNERLANLEKQRETIINESRNERWWEYTLERIKKEIKEKWMSFELTKEFLENIEKIPEENKPFILWGIFSGLNQIGIWINGIDGTGKIVFNTPEKPFNQEWKIADYAETIKYKNLINNCISSGKISISDVTKALLYRTTSIDDYINEKVDKNFSTSKYVERLLEKYKIHGWIKWIKVMVQSEQWLKDLKKIINDAITDNQADKEFLLIYIDDLYYRKDSSLDEWEITTYNNISDKNQKAVLKELNNLNEEQRFALWVRDSNEATQVAKEATKDPVWFMKKSLNANNFTVALMTWLLGWILSALFGKWFWKGFLGGAILWFAWAAWWVDFLKGQLDKHWKKWEWESKEWEEKASDKKTNSIFETYKWVLISQNEESKLTGSEVLIKWDELSKNDKFLSAPASFFDIFSNEKNEANLKEEFKKYWVELTEENKKYYEYIFRELLLAKKRAVWEFNKDETIKSYLERTSKVVVWWNTWNKKAEWWKSEKAKELSENEKKAILDYFWIKESEVKDLMKNLEVLWLDLFQLLNWYKNFIETKLVWLNGNILSKIKEAIKRKTLLINSKIDELKTKEMDKYKSLDNFKNNRWIVNNEIKELFEKINFQILPSAFVLVESKKTSEWKSAYEREKFKRINDMFDSDLTSDGDFDKTFFSTGEIWDSSRNNWEVFDMTDEKDFKYLQETWSFDGNEIWKISLLNEKDNEIEEKAMMWYIAWCAVLIANAWASFTWVWTIPWVVIWTWYSAIDAFKDEDLLISILKTSWAIPEEYRTDKNFIDNILAWIWAIPLLWPALKAIPLTAKITAFISKLSPEKLVRFEAMKAEMLGKLTEKFPKIFKSTQITDDFWNLTTWKQVTITDDFWNLISSWTPNKINKAKEVVNWIFENRFIWKTLDELWEGKNIEIWWVTFTKTKGMYNWNIEWTNKELTKKQLLEFINNRLSIEDKQKFIVWIKESQVLAKEAWKVRKIDWNNVEIIEWWVWKVRKTDWTILEWDELKLFINNNIDKLSKEFKWMSISEWWVKLRNWIENWYKNYGIKTVWDYLEKAWFKDWDKSKLFWEWSKPIDALWWIVLTPATTIRQLIDAIPKWEWENIFKILISWNKNIKVWGWIEKSTWVWDFFSKIAFDSWIVRAWVIWYWVTQLDDLTGIDKNNWTWDEIWDYAFYRYGWIINTLILKALNK